MNSFLSEDYLRPSEVAAIVRKNPTTVRRWIKLGLLPAVRLPGNPDKANYLIRRQDVERLLEVKPIGQALDDDSAVANHEISS